MHSPRDIEWARRKLRWTLQRCLRKAIEQLMADVAQLAEEARRRA